MKISASILAAKIINLENTLKTIDPNKVDYLHMDVMDGNFVPQISFGEAISKEVRSSSEIPLDVHLMVSKPENHVTKYFDLKPSFITFHLETTHFPIRLAQEVKKHSKVGVSINPGTPVEVLKPMLPYVDLILIMTVEPGYYGQKFIDNGFEKIKNTKSLIGDYPILLEVDGGINLSNIQECKKLGVDICVVGSALFNSQESVNETARKLKN